VFALLLSVGSIDSFANPAKPAQTTQTSKPKPSRLPRVDQLEFLRMAHSQIGVTTGYDGTYRVLNYPNGDVPQSTGVCTDVVIRALRTIGLDLQKEVHEDMLSSFASYPKKWGLHKPDPNIDHRRVPNLMTYFSRKGYALPIKLDMAAFRAGDIVTWDLNATQTHIGIVSDEKTPVLKRPKIIHNIGSGTQQEDVLFDWKITGHYRLFE
jgi:uncharacterized protein